MIHPEKTFRSLLSVDDFTCGKYTHLICKSKVPAILHEKTTEINNLKVFSFFFWCETGELELYGVLTSTNKCRVSTRVLNSNSQKLGMKYTGIANQTREGSWLGLCESRSVNIFKGYDKKEALFKA